MTLSRLLAAVAIVAVAMVAVTWAFPGSSEVSAAPSASMRVALLIANAGYADGDAELTTPVADAEKLAEALKRLGFQTQIEKNLRKKPMEDAIESFVNRVEPGAVAVFFFAGYGIQAGDTNYLIPIDPRIWSEADLLREGVSLEEVQSKLARRNAKARFVILEAARRNPFERRFRSVSSGLAASPSEPGLVRMYSAANTVLSDSPAAKNSVLVTELASNLAPDRRAVEAFEAARDAISKQGKAPQTPYFTSGLAEDFWLDASQKPLSAPIAKAPAPKADEPAPKSASSAQKSPAPAPTPPEPAQKAAPTPPESAASGPAAPPKGPVGKITEYAAPAPKGPGPAAKSSEPEAPKKTGPAPAPVETAAHDPKPVIVIKEYSASDAARRDELDARIAHDPADETSISARGQLLAMHRDYTAALADFETSTRLNPGNVFSWNNRCWIHAIANELAKALDDCNEAIKRRPKFADAFDSRGMVRLKQGDAEAAATDYSKAIQINPSHASALYGRGLARMRLGQKEDARLDLEKAKSIDPQIEAEYLEYGLK